MAQIALPRQQVTQTQPAQSAAPGVGSPLYQRRHASNAGPIELIPNPDFSFPMRNPDGSAAESASTSSVNGRPMSLQAYPSGRRGSAQAQRQKSVSALPDFSFNPAGTSKPATTGGTPPQSPALATTPTTPSRPIGGHRRGGSEFIGGDARNGGASLMSSSPTKEGGVMAPSTATLRPGPPAGRRGHAHRRSGAISSHDLSAIVRPADPNAAPRAGSAPVTPLEGDQFVFGHSVNKSLSQPSLRNDNFFPDENDSSPRRPPSRARVGFADKVEYIRPLSTISSETETSLSTVRGGHSATGSLSSIVSGGASTPPRMSRPSVNTAVEARERPSTAGAILDMSPQKNSDFGSDMSNRKRPMSAISPASPTAVASPVSSRVSAKRRGFFRLETRRSDPSFPTLPSSASDPSISASAESPPASPMKEDEEAPGQPEKCKARKANRKPRKVKSWANSIISRKGKHGGKSKRRAQTPPPQARADSDDSSESEEVDFEANFDVDNTVTIVSPTETQPQPPLSKLKTDYASWKPRELKRVDSDTMSPTIDLDAALGPFNTPQSSGIRGQQRGFGAHRRAMHSAGGLVPSHRRTESAPELVPFEQRTSALGTPSTMADVFEEEEPEEEPDNTGAPSVKKDSAEEEEEEEEEEDDDDGEAEDPKIQVVEADEKPSGPIIKWNFSDGLKIRRGDKARFEDPEPLSPRQNLQPSPSESSTEPSLGAGPVEVVEDYEEPRTSSLTHSSDSTVTPQISAEDTKEQQTVMSLPLQLPQQSLMTPDTYSSSISSPDYRSSQASLDTPRLGTSTSSATDYCAMPSPRFGEPGPEMRVSVDDVPSLTSSRSTTTSNMQNAFPVMMPRRAGERSTSLSSAPSDVEQRRRKRSSIASLSRLINSSSFGEKSKLSIEQRPQSEYLEPSREAKKKHKRLSKLMFWKPNKDKDPSTATQSQS